MKKVIICLVLAIIFSNCELKVRESKAQNYDEGALHYYKFRTEVISGMTYGIWYLDFRAQSHHTGYAITTVNLTKDSLEVELLRRKLK